MANSNTSSQKQLRVTLRRGLAGKLHKHRACVRGLGLRRLNHTVTLPDTPEIRGMITKVAYMLEVEEI